MSSFSNSFAHQELAKRLVGYAGNDSIARVRVASRGEQATFCAPLTQRLLAAVVQSSAQPSAIQLLSQVAKKGDPEAIAALASQIEHASEEVRKAAMQGLARVGVGCEAGRAVAAAAVITRLEDTDWRIRQAA
eukprot:CAMPEP_0115143218 /NCGR_PEP_ID=MMETSP0227-20121206/60637_1 /TAXON_ID=89957 /ORGANISM="Polarella glacialis, Strain CCMP 1383" /LENGTH=132 /DNA_ID=CAMNT_0002551999 /DNA_START=32 /DNA_END=427 /DNA_ORIENTATION=+